MRLYAPIQRNSNDIRQDWEYKRGAVDWRGKLSNKSGWCRLYGTTFLFGEFDRFAPLAEAHGCIEEKCGSSEGLGAQGEMPVRDVYACDIHLVWLEKTEQRGGAHQHYLISSAAK